MTIPRIQNVKLISACLAPGWFSSIALAEEKTVRDEAGPVSVRPQCLPPQLPPASYCKLQACIPLWALMVPVSCSCCAPNWPHDSPSPLPHCMWRFPMSNSFPSMTIPKCPQRGQDPFPCSSFYGYRIANTIYSASIIWIIFIAIYLLYLQPCLKLLNSSPLCCLPPHTIITGDIWDVLPQKFSPSTDLPRPTDHYVQSTQTPVLLWWLWQLWRELSLWSISAPSPSTAFCS